MIRHSGLVSALAATLLMHAGAAHAGNAADEARVIEAMRSMYAAATKDDLEMFRKFTTPDFYSFDGGARFSGDELMQLIKSAHVAGKIYVWQVTEPKVELYGREAFITYTNRGSVRDADGTKRDVTWLESALLKKEHGAWRIHFFHSTRVPNKN